MKTEQLIDVLAAHAGAVDMRAPARWLAWAALGGLVVALPLMVWTLGINPVLAESAGQPMFWVKLAFIVAIVVCGWNLLRRAARPGGRTRRAWQALAVLVGALWVLALAVLAAAPAEARTDLLLGSTWDRCPINIAMLSMPALVFGFFAVRGLAPTQPALAGAAVGLFAGALGALVYLLHCPELAAPFIALWYVLGMLVPTLIGAAIGRAVLRW
jgi:hypothetical protein